MDFMHRSPAKGLKIATSTSSPTAETKAEEREASVGQSAAEASVSKSAGRSVGKLSIWFWVR